MLLLPPPPLLLLLLLPERQLGVDRRGQSHRRLDPARDEC